MTQTSSTQTFKRGSIVAVAAAATLALAVSGCTGAGAGSGGDSAGDNNGPESENGMNGTSSIKQTDYPAVADAIESYAASFREAEHVGAIAIGIITTDGLAETRFLGENHVGDPVTANTLFEIGSASKAFLGVTEAILVDAGELNWKDRVIEHYPSFEMNDPWVTQEMRIDDLIAQRTGLAEYSSETPNALGFPWETNVEGLKYLEPTTSFRSAFAYQNIPHFVAGEIVAEKVGAESWNEAVGDMLFEPLGMTSSGTSNTALASSEDATRGHTVVDGEVKERPIEAFPSIAEGAGSIVSNLEDMSKWIGLHLNRGESNGAQVVSAKQLEYTYTPMVPVTDEHFIELVKFGGAEGRDQVSYATGWFVHATPEGRVIEHGGNTAGYNSAVMFDPDRGVGLVVMSNQGIHGGVATHIGKYGMDLLQGREPLDYLDLQKQYRERTEKAAAEERAQKKELEQPLDWYVGAYGHELLGTLDIKLQGDVLTTTVGPDAREATVTRDVGHDFIIEWQPDDPNLEKVDSPGTFEIAGSGTTRPDRLVIKGFVFERAE